MNEGREFKKAVMMLVNVGEAVTLTKEHCTSSSENY